MGCGVGRQRLEAALSEEVTPRLERRAEPRAPSRQDPRGRDFPSLAGFPALTCGVDISASARWVNLGHR
ncbi:hypothetical protein MHYP_G00000360 [Metynnis hypsauchen]